MVQVPTDIHIGKGSISAFYSSKQAAANGVVIRNWLAPQSFQAQRDFGLEILEREEPPHDVEEFVKQVVAKQK
jgi:hypothetical protein